MLIKPTLNQCLAAVWTGLVVQFARIPHNNHNSWKVVVSYLEIYNEHIRDLLSTSSRPLSLRENPALGFVHVASLTEAAVINEQEVLQLLRAGNTRRRVEPTVANRVSSRSHAILQVSFPTRMTTMSHANHSAFHCPLISTMFHTVL